jgi:hypothetical protein
VTPGAAFDGNVHALQIIGNTLYVGSAFQNGAKIPAADYILSCDLSTGVASSAVLNDNDLTGAGYALAADSNGDLYAGGNFINLGGILAADYVAAYNGTWNAMGSGPGPSFEAFEGIVRRLTANGTDVYIGTDAVDVAGISAADDIAYFEGSAWRPVGSDGDGDGALKANMIALAIFGGKLYAAAGKLTSAGGDVPARSMAAYALNLPDARIGTASAGPFLGNAIYSAAAVGESRTIFVKRGMTRSFWVSIQNDDLPPASFTIKGRAERGGSPSGNNAARMTSRIKSRPGHT